MADDASTCVDARLIAAHASQVQKIGDISEIAPEDKQA